MNKSTFAIIVTMGLLTASPVLSDQVVLTRPDVSSAADIEAAINRATKGGTEPGTVVLDGRAREFVFSGPDRTINIGVSNLTLRGINWARVWGCDAAIYFTGKVSSVLVEGINFSCTGNGVLSTAFGPRKDVVLRDNAFLGGGRGIAVGDATNWKVVNNVIIGEIVAVSFAGGRNVKIINNELVGGNGVQLENHVPLGGTRGYHVIGNRIHAIGEAPFPYGFGIRLDGEAVYNVIKRNRICLRNNTRPGIFLGAETYRNRVRHNRVSSVAQRTSLVVEDQGTRNRVYGNRRARPC